MKNQGIAGANRPIRVLGAGSAVCALAAALGWAAGSPAHVFSSLVSAIRTGDDIDTALAATAGVAGWACLSWFAAVIAFEAGATVPGLLGSVSGWIARHLGPRSARTAARWLLGATIATAPLVSIPALSVSAYASVPVSASAYACVAAIGASPGVDASPAAPAMLDRPIATASVIAEQPVLDRSGPTPTAGPAAPITGPAAPTVGPTPAAGRAAAAGLALVQSDSAASPVAGYVVRPGDTLWAIASHQLGPHQTAAAVAAQWPRWYAANREVIGDDPNLIRPGELLHAPPA